MKSRNTGSHKNFGISIMESNMSMIRFQMTLEISESVYMNDSVKKNFYNYFH